MALDPAFYTLSLLRRRKLNECVERASQLLERNPYDQQVWFLKARALTLQAWVDDTEMEEEGVAEVLLDEHAMNSMPRPGTSLKAAGGTAGGTSGGRPGSSARPLSGFVRPGTQQRSGSRAGTVEAAFQGSRPGTSRPVTSSGRFVRLGTASLVAQEGGPFINAERLDLQKYANRAPLAKVLCDYIIYVDRRPMLAAQLASYATEACKYSDWFWKARLGKCYYQLSQWEDSEQQFRSALKHGQHVVVYLELAKKFYKIDQPLAALELFESATKKNSVDEHLLVGMARAYDMLNDTDSAVAWYRKVLQKDASNVEAIASLASHSFYDDRPEVALRMYRRLLQMGLSTTELWNNLGLCCFYASQYDTTLSCFERALSLANDTNMGDVWYNIGQVAVSIGDLGLAYQAFKVALSVDSNHAESANNLAVLELRKGNLDQARTNFFHATSTQEDLHEPHYNAALLAFKLGDFQEAYTMCNKAFQAFPDHAESLELKKQLRQHFTTY